MHARDVFPQIKREYIDTGKIRYVFRDLQWQAQTRLAANFSHCANEQGKFLEMHGAIMANQANWVSQADPKEAFLGYARQLGLDTTTLSACASSGKYNASIDNDANAATSVGINSTPTFVINGRVIVGAYPYANFKQILDEELRR